MTETLKIYLSYYIILIMNKKLLSVFLLLVSTLSIIHAEEYTWTWKATAANNNFQDINNWDVLPSKDANASAMGYPRNLMSNTSVAVFNSSVDIELPAVSDFYVSEIRIMSGTVSFSKVNSMGSTAIGFEGLGLSISSGARLNIVCNVSGIKLLMNASANNCTIEGTLDLTGTGGSTATPKLEKGSFVNPLWKIGAGGRVILSGSTASIANTSSSNLKFLLGSTLEISRDAGGIPDADYQAGSMILINGSGPSGVTVAGNGPSAASFNGDITWDRANTNSVAWSQNMPDLNGTFYMKKGNLELGSGYAGLPPSRLQDGTYKINNLVVSGGVFKVAIAGEAGFNNTTPAVAIVTINNLTVSGTGYFGLDRSNSNKVNKITIANDFQILGGTVDIAGGSANCTFKVAGISGSTNGTSILTESGTSTGSKFIFGGSAAQSYAFNGAVSGNDLNFEVDNSASDVTLISSLTVPKDLILTKGNLILGGNNLTVNNLAMSGSLASHVVTNGTGNIKILGVDAAGKDFPVGISAASFDPVNIKNTMATNDFSVSVGSTITAGVPAAYTTVIPRQWEIVSASAGATLAFTPGVGTVNASEIGHFVGGTWVFTSSTTVAPTYTGVFTSFSPFIIASQVLPVELVSFTAKKVGTVNVLNWQTASEKNNSHFDIERSNNGENNWTSVGTVKGNGNSVITQNYRLEDYTPLSISYYRLKQVDFDGRSEYSNVVSVIGKSGKFNIASVTPNPTKETSTILFESAKNENIFVTLTDLSGKVMYTQNHSITEGVNTVNLNMVFLSNGIYIMTMRNSESVLTLKIVKQ
jgi:hypothetical protein